MPVHTGETNLVGASTTSGRKTRLVAVGIIWVASAMAAVGAPDMVTGSQHEHLPLAAITVWVWTGIASGYAAMTPVDDARDWLMGIGLVWIAMAVATVLAPVMETGSDPTTIPVAALVAPPMATAVTGFLALSQANARRR